MATSKPVQLHVTCTISNPSNHLAATQYIYASECGREMISVTSSVLLVPDGLVWIFQKLLICWYFHTQPPLGLKENGPTLYIYCIKIYGLSAKFLLCKQRMMSSLTPISPLCIASGSSHHIHNNNTSHLALYLSVFKHICVSAKSFLFSYHMNTSMNNSSPVSTHHLTSKD